MGARVTFTRSASAAETDGAGTARRPVGLAT